MLPLPRTARLTQAGLACACAASGALGEQVARTSRQPEAGASGCQAARRQHCRPGLTSATNYARRHTGKPRRPTNGRRAASGHAHRPLHVNGVRAWARRLLASDWLELAVAAAGEAGVLAHWGGGQKPAGLEGTPYLGE